MADKIPVAEIMYVRYPDRYPPRIIRFMNMTITNKIICHLYQQCIHAMLPMRVFHPSNENAWHHNNCPAVAPLASDTPCVRTFEMHDFVPAHADVHDLYLNPPGPEILFYRQSNQISQRPMRLINFLSLM